MNKRRRSDGYFKTHLVNSSLDPFNNVCECVRGGWEGGRMLGHAGHGYSTSTWGVGMACGCGHMTPKGLEILKSQCPIMCTLQSP
jgi:hypothetical protein